MFVYADFLISYFEPVNTAQCTGTQVLQEYLIIALYKVAFNCICKTVVFLIAYKT